MKKITCHHCLQPKAILTIPGERSSQYACQHCGEVFEADHPRREHRTQARPQAMRLPAVRGASAIEPASPQP